VKAAREGFEARQHILSLSLKYIRSSVGANSAPASQTCAVKPHSGPHAELSEGSDSRVNA
jgi:hypothetical protein